MSLPLYIHKRNLGTKHDLAGPVHVIFDLSEEQLEIKTPKPCKIEYVWGHLKPKSCFFILSFEKNIVQDIT
jgi:hypothetical protein